MFGLAPHVYGPAMLLAVPCSMVVVETAPSAPGA